MEVRPGYKQTEMGVIPGDWKFGELGDLNPTVTSGSRGWAKYYSDLGAAFLRITNLSRDSIYIDLSDLKLVRLPPNDTEGLRTQLKVGDLLISITADIGIIGYVDPSMPTPAYINQHIALLRFDESKIDTKFLSYFLASEKPQRGFRAGTDQGAKAGMNLSGVRKIRTILPPLPEQRAIAAALSDVDALLAKLDALIAKKRDLKQAAMQQLLTGQTRLPGFSGEWAVTRLGEVADLLKGSGLSKNVMTASGSRKCILYGELFTTYGQVIHDVVGRTNSPDGRLSIAGDVLVPGSTTTDGIDLATASALLEGGVALGGDINIIRCRDANSFNPCFLANYLAHIKKGEIAERAQGTTIVHLYGRDLSDLSLDRPDIAEQTVIANVLADMDAELATLEIRRDKTRAIKQGMMHELLTGRIRLL